MVETLSSLLARHRRLVGIAVLATMTVSIAAALLQRRAYTTHASFIPQSGRGGSSLSGIALQLGLSGVSGEAAQSPQFYVDLLRSRSLLRSVVEKRYTVAGDGRPQAGTLADHFKIDDERTEVKIDRAVLQLQRLIKAGAAQRTGVVYFSVSTNDPRLSFLISKQLLEEVNSFNLEKRQSQAIAERVFVEQRLGQVGAELRQMENALQSFLQENREIRNSPRLLLEEERLQRLVVLRQSVYNTLATEYEQAKLGALRDTPVITVIETPRAAPIPDPRRWGEILVTSIVGGLVLGLALAFVREYRLRRREAV